ncbi:MAG: putative ribosomal N-acetyltransferase YdaF [Firmicutes bacterium ADurb.Bin456]|nr:MAG: putative ribosomal N-acetyltransferase YdaF [Firmicutes bacterium ADurb.Bin456]
MHQLLELETTRFTLRKIEDRDLETLHSYWSDEAVTKYMNATFKSMEQTRQMVDILNILPEIGEGRRWVIVEKANGVVVGSCGYHNLKVEHRRAEVGFELGREHWGRGIMQEVMHRIIRHCFEDLNLNRIEAFVTAGNHRSLKALEKLGFKQEGVLRKYEFIRTDFHDQVILSLLRSDWGNNCCWNFQ